MNFHNFLKKIFENVRKFYQKFSGNFVFCTNAQKLTPCLVKLWENKSKIMHFRNFLKKIFKSFRNFFWKFLKKCLKKFWEIFWKFFENFWNFFLKKCSPPPKKNPGYAHAVPDNNGAMATTDMTLVSSYLFAAPPPH